MNSSTVQRLLSRRDRWGGKHDSKSITSSDISADAIPRDYHGLFVVNEKVAGCQEEQKIRVLRKRVAEAKSINVDDCHILFALRSRYAVGDIDKAFDLLSIISDSWEGLVFEYNPTVKILGAENRNGVTCYLDSVLFSMFSRLDSFEAMLFDDFADKGKGRLAMLMRLWVNLLRSGKLITTEVTQLLQESLAECGWKEAAELHQQDASEAFTFITEKLELPLLTLKMDIYHTGREDAADDHKFINERLLEVAVPTDGPRSDQTVPLEDCLEAYFNNRIEVTRYLERQNTLNSMRKIGTPELDGEKTASVHVEAVEVDAARLSPLPSSAKSPTFEVPIRGRAASIIQQRFVGDAVDSDGRSEHETAAPHIHGRLRSGSLRKEVMMPAWQFFSLIPWYTNNTPQNDAQVAAHFSSKRPVLGMCLKRYTFTEQGESVRLSTRIDIPTEIGLPHFISDDSLGEDGPIFGNFKLSLQSAVCHRGTSVESGHYISLVKGTNTSMENEQNGVTNGAHEPDHWMRFDDMASQRITLVDINQALKDETPYLLFYQIVPIDEIPRRPTEETNLPSSVEPEVQECADNGNVTESLRLRTSSDETQPTSRPSYDVTSSDDSVRGRSPVREQVGSRATKSDEANVLDLASSDRESHQLPLLLRRDSSLQGAVCSQNRSQSQSGDKFAISLGRMGGRKSKETARVIAPPSSSEDGLEVPLTSSGHETGKLSTQKEGKREKSKSRLSRVSNMGGRNRADKPDRECSVM